MCCVVMQRIIVEVNAITPIMWLERKEKTGSTWRFINGYRDAFETKHPRTATIVSTAKARNDFVKVHYLPCSAGADANEHDEDMDEVICPTVLMDLAGLNEDEHSSIFDSAKKKNKFIEFCKEKFDEVSNAIFGDADARVDACKVFVELGKMWRDIQCAARDKLRRDGLASISEAFGWQGCALISEASVSILMDGGRYTEKEAIFSWEDDGAGDLMFGKCTVV